MPKIDELRAKPEFAGLPDEAIVRSLALDYPEVPLERIRSDLGVAAPAAAPAGRTMGNVIGDTAVSAAKGVVGLGESAVGIADLASGGRAGRVLESSIGYRPKETQQALGELYSDPQKQAFQKVQDAQGFGGKVVAALQNPSTIAHSVVESLPSMLGGAAIARGVMGVGGSVVGAAGPQLPGALSRAVGSVQRAAGIAGAAGEGLAMAGSAAETIRQETGGLTGEQTVDALAIGAGGAGFALLGASVAKKLGIHDVDTMLAAGAANPQAAKGIVRRLLEGAFSEGVLEELPQSVMEQVIQNKALDRPLEEGVDQAAVMGLLAGAAMGAGGNVLGGARDTHGTTKPAVNPAAGPLSAAAATAGATGTATGAADPKKLADAVDAGVKAATEAPDLEAERERQINLERIAHERAQAEQSDAEFDRDAAVYEDVTGGRALPEGATASAQRADYDDSGLTDLDAQAHEAAPSPMNDRPEPTEAQKEAGNYKKGHVKVHGLDISIENPAGSERRGKRPDGTEWAHMMSDHYGYIKRTTGADDEQVDVYVGPKPEAAQVYIVDQMHQGTGKFDEHKVMLGYPSRGAAVNAYRSNFDKDWKVGRVTAMSVDQFKQWLKEGDLKKPASPKGAMVGPDLFEESNAAQAEPQAAAQTTVAGVPVPSPRPTRAPAAGPAAVQAGGLKSITAAEARALVAGKTENPGGVDPVQQIDAGEGNGKRMLLGNVPLADIRANEDGDRYDSTVDLERAKAYAARPAKDAPPVILVRSRKTGALNVLDGGHRVTAARLRGDISIRAIISEHAPARTVTIGDESVELTPEQARQWDAADDEATAERAAVEARYKASSKERKGGDPDMGLRSPKEQRDAELKRIGMELSAKRRKIAGRLTTKEKAAEDKQRQAFKVGDRVLVDGKPGTVQGTPFGRVKVLLDGEDKPAVHPRANVKKGASDATTQGAEDARSGDVPADTRADVQEPAGKLPGPDDVAREDAKAPAPSPAPGPAPAPAPAEPAGQRVARTNKQAVLEVLGQTWGGEHVLSAERVGDIQGDVENTGSPLGAERAKAILEELVADGKVAKDGDKYRLASRPPAAKKGKTLQERRADGKAKKAGEKAPAVNSEAPEHTHVEPGVSAAELKEMAEAFQEARQREMEGDEKIHSLFDDPAKKDVVRLIEKAGVREEKKGKGQTVYHRDAGWMTLEEAKKHVEQWKAHAAAQYGNTPKGMKPNTERVVLSLFDLTGKWSQPWEEAGYQVYRFDIQEESTYIDEDGNEQRIGDVMNFSSHFFADIFGAFDGNDVHAILAACPCTDFTSAGARHFAAKDADGRTVASVKLVRMTQATVEFFKPSVWAIENPVGRIESLTGLPPWRLAFDPYMVGPHPYTKKTLLWGRFNADLPIAPVEPTEGSKMHSQYGGSSIKTKNARSETPEGFAYSFFMANNAHDHLAMTLANKYDRLPRTLFEEAVAAGLPERDIENAVDDAYYIDLDDKAAEEALREAIAEHKESAEEPATPSEQKAASGQVVDALNRYDEGELSARDLLDEVRSIDDLPAGVQAAVDAFDADIAEDFKDFGGRGDLDTAGETFAEAVRKAVEPQPEPGSGAQQKAAPAPAASEKPAHLMSEAEFGAIEQRRQVADLEEELRKAKAGELQTGKFARFASKAAAVRELTAELDKTRAASPEKFAADHLAAINRAREDGQDTTPENLKRYVLEPLAKAKGEQDRHGLREEDRQAKKLGAAAAELAGQMMNDALEADFAPEEVLPGLREFAKDAGVPADDLRQEVLKQLREPGIELTKANLRKLEAALDPVKAAKREKAPTTASPGKVEDFGEKIGGARKDTATSTGPRRSTESDDRPTWAKRFKISQIVAAPGQIGGPKDEGRWVINDSRSLDWMGKPKQVGRTTFATKEEAEAFVPLAAVAMKHRVVAASDGKYEIWRDISDRKRVKVVEQQFDSREAAQAYMAQHAAQILETNTTFGEADLPLPPDRRREGPARRTGDVDAKNFMDTFGLRGVEFGNWNNQQERQALMNDAYDGLMDLADVLGVPPKALSLNGELSLAFGARGQGLSGARAHYEHERAVINLTKESGAGSLAHEWFHAADHYFGRQDGKASAEWVQQADGTRKLKARGPEDDMVSHGFRRQSGVREEVRAAYDALITTIAKKATTYVEDTAKADKFTARAREDLAQQLEQLRRDLATAQTWKQRNNQPASAEQLAQFDAIAQRLLNGEAQAVATDWRSIETAKNRIAHRWTNDAIEELGAIFKAVRGRVGFDSASKNGPLDRLAQATRRYSERLKMLADAQAGAEKVRMMPTEFAMNAKELDQGRGGDYWTTPHEMAARAFQGFVEDKIAEAGGTSRFLNYAPQNAGILTPWGVKFPYPRGTERIAINKALQNLVDTLQTRETDKGLALFAQEDVADKPSEKVLKAEKIVGGIDEDQAVLYHSGDASIDGELASGIEPKFGDWLEEVLAGATDDDETAQQIRDADPVAFYSEAPSWVAMKVARVLDKPVRDVTVDDIRKHGQLSIVVVDKDDHSIWRSNGDGTADQFQGKGRYSMSEVPFGVESADVFTTDSFVPDITLTGNDLVQFLARNFPDQNAARFRQGPGSAPVSAQRVADMQATVDELTSQWENAPEVTVLPTIDHPGTPAAVRKEAAAQRANGGGNVQAVFYNGEVLLFADRIPDMQRAKALVHHEVLGHYGLRAAFGRDLDPILKQIAMVRRADVSRMIRRRGLQEHERLIAAEEVLAEMAERTPHLGFVQRAVAAIKAFLRRVGLLSANELSDEEIIASYILPARKAVEGGTGTGFRSAPAFAQEERRRTPREVQVDGKWRPDSNSAGKPIVPASQGTQAAIAFWRWFGDSKVVDDQGRPLVVYHGTHHDITEFKRTKGAHIGFHFGDVEAANTRTEDTAEARIDKEEVERLRVLSEQRFAELSAYKEALRRKDGQAPMEEIAAALERGEDFLPIFDRYKYQPTPQEKAELERLEKAYRATLLPINKTGAGSTILPVYLAIKKPLRMPDVGNWGSAKTVREALPWDSDARSLSQVRDEIEARGYDGIVYANRVENPVMKTDSYIVFEPTQIKSATGNAGTFDASSPNILASVNRRGFLVGTAAALAANPAEGETTLGRAKALPAAVMGARLPPAVEKLLVGQRHGTTNLEGAKAIREALDIIAKTGPQEVRALAANIRALMPESGIAVQVDKGNWNVHGAVELEPLVRLRLMDGERTHGMTYDTFLHESLHAAVAARYRSLSVGVLRSNDAKMGMPAPAAAAAMQQFRDVWGEFKEVALRGLRDVPKGSDLHTSLEEAIGDPDEFFVRSLTEPNLQAWLAQREYRGKTLWDRFKAWVKSSLLGLKEEGTKASWLDAALLASDDLVKAMAGDKPDFERMRAISRLQSRRVSAVGSASDVLASANPYLQQALDGFNEFRATPGKLNWWHKTLGTPYDLAQRSPMFKAVYDKVQHFLNDISHFATEAADLAPRILPKLDSWRDWKKAPISAEDSKALVAPIFEGTLGYARDERGQPVKMADLEARYAHLDTAAKAKMLLARRIVTEAQLKRWEASPLDVYEGAVRNRFEAEFLRGGIVFKDAELRSIYGLNDAQIGLYREALAAAHKSLTHVALSDMVRYGGKPLAPIADQIMAATSLKEAGELARDYLLSLEETGTPAAAAHNDTAATIMAKADRAQSLIDHGYFPLSRFGTYTVDVVDKDGERVYFGLFESRMEARAMAKKMREQFPEAAITRGTTSQQGYQLFKGITPETAELFGEMLGLEADGDSQANLAFQKFLKEAKASRSAMKRLIARKGIAGFSEDVSRVLAGFVYSNSRQASTNLHLKGIAERVDDIPQGQGELKDAAVRLQQYVMEPQEEAAGLRNLLFAQFLGGSVAAMMVNMTQPFAVTAPYLTQFASVRRVGALMRDATRDVWKEATGDAALDAALKRAAEEGIVAPQEVHQLMAMGQGRGELVAGDGTRLGQARAMTRNLFSRAQFLWGQPFAVAELFNRRLTFIAAYRLATEKGMADPAGFAAKAIADTQFTYNKGNKPEWARGAVGAFLFTFKQYSISYLELVHRMYTQGGPEGKKAALLMLAMLLMMGGAGGLPFVEDVSDLIDGIGQRLGLNIRTKHARQQFLENTLGKTLGGMVDRGITGLPGMPVDVAARFGMGNLIPGTGLLTKKKNHTRDVVEILGPGGEFASRVYEGVGKTLDGQPVAGALTAAPKAIGNLGKAYDMATLGYYPDTKGKKVVDTDTGDVFAKALGFQPVAVARVQEATRDVQQMTDFARMKESEIADRWAMGVFKGDAAATQSAKDELKAWNAANPDTPIRIQPQQITKRVREMRRSKEERVAATAPRELRAAVKRELEAGR